MAAPTPTQSSTSPPLADLSPTAAYATFMQHVLTEMLHELKSVRKELQDIRRHQAQHPPSQPSSRKRKRPVPTPPCTLCRLSRTPCVASHPTEACARCIRKQVECFDDTESDPPRVPHPPEDDGPEDAESEPEGEPTQPPAPVVWQVQSTYPPVNGLAYPPTPVKRERVSKACAECHARKRKCSGGPNCSAARVNGINGAAPSTSARLSPNKTSTPARAREPCADCRSRKRRCIHNLDGTLTPNKTPDERDMTDVDAIGEDVPPTDNEREPEAPASSSARHTPSHSRSRSPAPRWHYPPGPPPPPPHAHWSYADQHRFPPHPGHGHGHGHGHGAFVHDRPPYPHPHPHPHGPPPPHPHGLHPHPHARLPPAPDMRHPSSGTTCKDCHARGVPCTCGSDPNHPAPPVPIPALAPVPLSASKHATPAPAAAVPPAGRKGRACLACRKLKMRCVAPNEDGGPDERCQRCERAGLECVYVDRKRRGPGGVFPPTPGQGQEQPSGDEAARKKLKLEGSPSASSTYQGPTQGDARSSTLSDGRGGVVMQLDERVQMQRVGEDAARALEESFADGDVSN